jgi:putative DNA methylase
LEADLAWHVRAWGQWVLAQARRELARFYPTYADFETLKPGHIYYEKRPMQLAPLTEDGLPDMAALNAEFAPTYLEDEKNPRWVAKPTVAYLWARTVTCKNSACRATVPLLKTRWLAKKEVLRGFLWKPGLSVSKK